MFSFFLIVWLILLASFENSSYWYARWISCYISPNMPANMAGLLLLAHKNSQQFLIERKMHISFAIPIKRYFIRNLKHVAMQVLEELICCTSGNMEWYYWRLIFALIMRKTNNCTFTFSCYLYASINVIQFRGTYSQIGRGRGKISVFASL